jgi:integrase
VPLTTGLVDALREHAAAYRMKLYAGKRSSYVFHHLRTTRNAIAGERIRELRGAFERAAKVAKLPSGFRKHDLRHRRATTWLGEGQSPVHVQQALGHADLTTTMGYYQHLPEHLRALVEPRPQPPERLVQVSAEN